MQVMMIITCFVYVYCVLCLLFLKLMYVFYLYVYILEMGQYVTTLLYHDMYFKMVIYINTNSGRIDISKRDVTGNMKLLILTILERRLKLLIWIRKPGKQMH